MPSPEGWRYQSAHPVARAITRYAEHRSGALPEASWFEALDGLGVRGSVEGRDVLVGRPSCSPTTGSSLPAELTAALAAAESRGATGIAVSWDGRARAVVVAADTVRETSADAVAELRRLGVEPVLLTGDGEGPARTAALQTGVATVVAEALPADKVALVRRLQGEGRGGGRGR